MQTPSQKQLNPDNELLEQANRLEAELLSEESIKENYRGSTARKHQVITESLGEVKITADITNIPCVQKDKFFCSFCITALFNNLRTLNFKGRPTNAFFAAVNQMFGWSSQLTTSAERCFVV